MAQFNINFEVPKHCIKKLNTIFNLDTIETDDYELVILTNVSGLNKDTLNTVDSNITNKEVADYTRPLIPIVLEETSTGYIVKTNLITANLNNITLVKGLLIVKQSSQDILACCLDLNLNLNEEFTISPQTNLWVLGDE